MSSHTTETESCTDLPTCDSCGETFTHETIAGPGEAHRSCGCPFVPDFEVPTDTNNALANAAIRALNAADDIEGAAMVREGALGRLVTDGGSMVEPDYACRQCGWTGDECDRRDHYPVCPECSRIVEVQKEAVADGGEEIEQGKLEAARSAGAHDEFIAFVAEYPDSAVAETLETAISLNVLDDFPGHAGSFAGALWNYGAKKAGNPDTQNRRRIEELFDEDRWPQWMQQEASDEDLIADGGIEMSRSRFECFECGFESADEEDFEESGDALVCPECESLRVEHVFTSDDEDADLIADGGVPENFEDLAGTCESCGDDVDPERLIEGECPGCHYHEPVADGGTAWTDLTGFKRDLLEAIQRLENDGETTYGLAIKREAERVYSEEVNHSQLYSNLDDLVDAGLVEKSELDKRTNEYALTDSAEAMLEQRARLLADACGLEQPVADGGDGQ